MRTVKRANHDVYRDLRVAMSTSRHSMLIGGLVVVLALCVPRVTFSATIWQCWTDRIEPFTFHYSTDLSEACYRASFDFPGQTNWGTREFCYMIGCAPTGGCKARYAITCDPLFLKADEPYDHTNTGITCDPPRDANPVTGACELPPKHLGCSADVSSIHSCDPGSGNKFHSETDVDASNGSLSFVRHYNSGSTANHGFGAGWTSNLHRRLEIARNTVVVRRGTGRGEMWSNTNTGWTGDADSTLQFAQDATGYTLTRANNDSERYDLNGKLVSETTAAGLTTQYAYDTNGRLETVTGPFGHTLTFAYQPTNGRLDTLTDSAGNVYRYGYTTQGSSYVLSEVTYPDETPGNTTDNPKWIYHYENASFPNHLTGITDENGDRFATFAYDANGRAQSTEHAVTDNVQPQEKFTLGYQ